MRMLKFLNQLMSNLQQTISGNPSEIEKLMLPDFVYLNEAEDNIGDEDDPI